MRKFLFPMTQHLVKVRAKLMLVANEREQSGTQWSLIVQDSLGDHPNNVEGKEPNHDEERIHCSNQLFDTHD